MSRFSLSRIAAIVSLASSALYARLDRYVGWDEFILDKPSGTRLQRGRGTQAKPKKRPNRNTISKRVRRKHRRAA